MALVIYTLLLFAMLAAMLWLSWLLGERGRGRATDRPFESGVPVVSDARLRVPARFYLVAVFFVIFDLEAAFLFAWAAAAREAGLMGFIEVALFILLLLAGLAYLWRVGALDWSAGRRQVS